MRKTLSSVTFMVALLQLAAAAAYAHGSGYRVCNNTAKPLAFSYVFRHGLGVLQDSWAWQGHYKVDARTCELLMPTHNAAGIYLNIRRLTEPRMLGDDAIYTAGKIRSSNGSAEIVNERLCEYQSGGPRVTRPFSGHARCPDNQKRTYTIFWSGLGQSHRDLAVAPHTLHLN